MFLLCSLFYDALSLPRGAYLDFPLPREWEAIAPAATVRCLLRTPSNHRTSCSDFRMKEFTSDLTSKNIWRASMLNVRSG